MCQRLLVISEAEAQQACTKRAAAGFEEGQVTHHSGFILRAVSAEYEATAREGAANATSKNG